MTITEIETALRKMRVHYTECFIAGTDQRGISVHDDDGIAGGVRFERFMGSLPRDSWDATDKGIFFKPTA